MKPEKYVVSLSGGKDSTAMLLRLLEEKRPVDLILFCDTGLEFPQMYEHLARLEAYIGRPITRLKAEHDFEYYFLHYTPKRKNPVLAQYSGMSWAGPRNRWCTGILKTRVINAYLKELREDYTLIEYVGIAADETKRVKDKNYPLVEWGMTEKDCLSYCYRRGFDWGGLYEIFSRVSCWCCPLQSLEELRKLYRHFPDLWQQLEEWDESTWRTFLKNYSVRQLAARFDFEDRWQAAGGNMPGATIAPDKTVLDLDVDAFRKVVDLNLFGTVLPTMVFVDVMAKNKKGAIVNFCSESALRPLTRVVGYGSAKAAIGNYTRYMATELATKFSPELRVNAIVPGFLLTNQNRALLTNPDGSYTDRAKTIIAHTPCGRFAEPEELFGTIHYLISDASSFVTGALSVVDGGFDAFSI